MRSLKRIKVEYYNINKDINSNNLEGIKISQIDINDFFHFIALLEGKKGTPYEGGTFKIRIEMPNDYPFEPMKINFLTKIFHPCIDSSGTICRCCFLPEICDFWDPSFTIKKILIILRERLYAKDINYEMCVKNKYLELLKLNREKYDEISREYTKYFAIENHEEISQSFDSKIKNLIDIGLKKNEIGGNENSGQINEYDSDYFNFNEDYNLMNNKDYENFYHDHE